ncbi:MAG: hypothetical protein MZW92_42085 [Comamonadaceae bacterium]|nr:hypothetical protein [Comamonadaceae bacterium]
MRRAGAGGRPRRTLSFVPPHARLARACRRCVVETRLPVRPVPRLDGVAPGRAACWPGRAPETPPPPLPAAPAGAGERAGARGRAAASSTACAPTAAATRCSQVVWKKVARSRRAGQPRRQHASAAASCGWTGAAAPAAERPRRRLSRLAAWVLAAERAGLDYGLRLPGPSSCRPAQGDGAPPRAALEALAHVAHERRLAAGLALRAGRGWPHLPREARDTLFLLAVIGWTLLPQLRAPAAVVRRAGRRRCWPGARGSRSRNRRAAAAAGCVLALLAAGRRR